MNMERLSLSLLPLDAFLQSFAVSLTWASLHLARCVCVSSLGCSHCAEDEHSAMWAEVSVDAG